jgi:hypothetical protein
MRSYREFWPFYVSQHLRPGTRALHFLGTSSVILCVAAAVAAQEWWLLLLGPVVAYGPAWIAHLFIERNKPATFTHPLWSLIGDFHMYGLMWLGRMDDEIQRLAGRHSRPHAVGEGQGGGKQST